MKIILVAKPHWGLNTIDLAHWRVWLPISAVCGGLVAAIFALGLWLGGTTTNGEHLAGVPELRSTLSGQQAEVERIRSDSQRNLDALAIKLGELQAQATRLNALGERLTRIGKLDDGEFNFREAPALGGVASPSAPPESLNSHLQARAERLQQQMTRQSEQLKVLESLLSDRTIDSSLLPAGMPVHSGYVSSGFGGRADPFTGRDDFHPGVDFDGERGNDVLAVADGVVTWSSVRPGYGNVVELDHGNGYMTRYAHNEKNVVQVGERVRVGQVLAKMGSTGRSTGTHVHFEVWLNDKVVNPYQYIHALR